LLRLLKANFAADLVLLVSGVLLLRFNMTTIVPVFEDVHAGVAAWLLVHFN
jgi:hypothetical protein